MEPATYIVGLICELASSWPGHLDVVFVGRNLSQNWAESQALPPNISVAYLPTSMRAAIGEIARRVRRSKYDLVHLCGWGHPVLLTAVLLAGCQSIPVVVETDTQSPVREGTWTRLVKRLFYPALFSIPRAFLPAGSRQASYLRKYGVPVPKIRIGRMTSDVSGIRQFVDAYAADRRADRRREIGISDNIRTVFLFVGRLEEFKGLTDLFDAYLRLRSQRDDVGLLIAGGGRFEPFVRDAASSIRSVYYLGHLIGQSVWETYCLGDVLVLPSRREPWGLVVNEAMAAGLPVIVTDVVGCIDDLVVNESTGLVIQRGKREALCSAMSLVADDVELRAKLGAAAYCAISDWTLSNEARTIESTWLELVA